MTINAFDWVYHDPFHFIFVCVTTGTSFFSNGLLLFIIFTTPATQLGSYRTLLVSVSVYVSIPQQVQIPTNFDPGNICRMRHFNVIHARSFATGISNFKLRTLLINSDHVSYIIRFLLSPETRALDVVRRFYFSIYIFSFR